MSPDKSNPVWCDQIHITFVQSQKSSAQLYNHRSEFVNSVSRKQIWPLSKYHSDMFGRRVNGKALLCTYTI